MSEIDTMPKAYCPGCPIQCELTGEEFDLRQELEMNNEALKNGFMGENGEIFDSMIDSIVGEIPDELLEQVAGGEVNADEAAQSIKTGVREQGLQEVERLEKEVRDLDLGRKAIADSCNRPLKMRASKNGKTYTVSVCSADRLYSKESPDHTHMPSHVVRTTK